MKASEADSVALQRGASTESKKEKALQENLNESGSSSLTHRPSLDWTSKMELAWGMGERRAGRFPLPLLSLGSGAMWHNERAPPTPACPSPPASSSREARGFLGAEVVIASQH